MEHYTTGYPETAVECYSNLLPTTVTQLGKERRYAVEAVKEFHVPPEPAKPHNGAVDHPNIYLEYEDIYGQSNLAPGEHGYIFIASQNLRKCLAPELIFKLIVGGHYFGVYQASQLVGQSLFGLEFLYLTEEAKINAIKCGSGSEEEGSPLFNKYMEDIIYARETIPYFIFLCVEKPPSPVTHANPMLEANSETASPESLLSVESPQISFWMRIPGERRNKDVSHSNELVDILPQDFPSLSKGHRRRVSSLTSNIGDDRREEDRRGASGGLPGKENIQRRQVSLEI